MSRLPCSDLAFKHRETDYGIDEHKRKNENSLSPEHKGKTGMPGSQVANPMVNDGKIM
jgi:hypothetical protein